MAYDLTKIHPDHRETFAGAESILPASAVDALYVVYSTLNTIPEDEWTDPTTPGLLEEAVNAATGENDG